MFDRRAKREGFVGFIRRRCAIGTHARPATKNGDPTRRRSNFRIGSVRCSSRFIRQSSLQHNNKEGSGGASIAINMVIITCNIAHYI